MTRTTINVSVPTTVHGVGARDSMQRVALPLRSSNAPKVARASVVRTSCLGPAGPGRNDGSFDRYATVRKAESSTQPYFQTQKT